MLSLTEVDHYILSTPEHHNSFTNQHKFFSGGLALSKTTFYQAVIQIVDLIPPNNFVVINSNGFTSHPGILHQKDFITLFQPSHIFALHAANNDPPMFDDRQIAVPIEKRAPLRSIADSRRFRNLRVTTYFFRGRGPVVSQQPVRLPLDRIRIGLAFDDYFDRTQLPALLSASVVLLCNDTREFPPQRKRLAFFREVAAVRCVGAALVRAVDVEDGALWIVTPAPIDDVNCVVLTQGMPLTDEFVGGCPRCSLTYAMMPNFPFGSVEAPQGEVNQE
jgi:polynucleotide 5'-kinase involved in rRNA processing